MRIIVDTNVLVSAVLKSNSLPFHVVRWIDQHGGVLKSVATEQEILYVLERPHIAAVPFLRSARTCQTCWRGLSWSPSSSGSLPAVTPPTTSFWSLRSMAAPISSFQATAICWLSIPFGIFPSSRLPPSSGARRNNRDHQTADVPAIVTARTTLSALRRQAEAGAGPSR